MPALQCDIRRGDLLLEVNGHDVQAKDFSAKLLHDCQSAASTDLVILRLTSPVAAMYTKFLTGSVMAAATEQSDDRSENEMSTKNNNKKAPSTKTMPDNVIKEDSSHSKDQTTMNTNNDSDENPSDCVSARDEEKKQPPYSS